MKISSNLFYPNYLKFQINNHQNKPQKSVDLQSHKYSGENFLKYYYVSFKSSTLREGNSEQQKLLSREEEKRLFDLAQNEKLNQRGQDARQEIILRNIGLIKKYAKPYARSKEHYNDLINAGAIVMMEKIDEFDTTRGTKFSTYIVPWLIKTYMDEVTFDRTIKSSIDTESATKERKHAISEYKHTHNGKAPDEVTLRKLLVPAPEDIEQALSPENKDVCKLNKNKIKKIYSTCNKLYETLGRAPTPDEIHESMFDEYLQKDIVQAPRTQTLDVKNRDGEYFDLTSFSDNLDEKLADKDVKTKITYFLGLLNDRDRLVLYHRFGIGVDEHTQKEIGEKYEISGGRVQQLEERALKNLAKVMQLSSSEPNVIDALLEENISNMPKELILSRLEKIINLSVIGNEKETILYRYGFKEKSYFQQEIAELLGYSSRNSMTIVQFRALDKLSDALHQFCQSLNPNLELPEQLVKLKQDIYNIPNLLRRVKGKPQEQDIREKIRELMEIHLSEREQLIMKLHYGYNDKKKNYTLGEIREKTGFKQSNISNAKKNATEKLLPYLQKLYEIEGPEPFVVTKKEPIKYLLNKIYESPEMYKPLLSKFLDLLENDPNIPPKDCEIVKLRYGFNDEKKRYAQHEAAEKLNITRSTIIKREKVTLDKIAYPIIAMHNNLYPDAVLPLPKKISKTVMSELVNQYAPIIGGIENILKTSLSEKEADIIKMIYGINKEGKIFCQSEIAQKYGCTPSNVLAIKTKSLEKIYKQLAEFRINIAPEIEIPQHLLILLDEFFELPVFLEQMKKSPNADKILAMVKDVIEKNLEGDERKIILYQYGFKGDPVGQATIGKIIEKSTDSVIKRGIRARRKLTNPLRELYKSIPKNVLEPQGISKKWSELPSEYKPLIDEVENILSGIKPEWRGIIRLRYGFTPEGDEHTLAETVKKLNSNKSAISALEIKAIEELFHPIMKLHASLDPDLELPPQLINMFAKYYDLPNFLKETDKSPYAKEIREEIRKKIEEIQFEGIEKDILLYRYGSRGEALFQSQVGELYNYGETAINTFENSARKKLAPYLKNIYGLFIDNIEMARVYHDSYNLPKILKKIDKEKNAPEIRQKIKKIIQETFDGEKCEIMLARFGFAGKPRTQGDLGKQFNKTARFMMDFEKEALLKMILPVKQMLDTEYPHIVQINKLGENND